MTERTSMRMLSLAVAVFGTSACVALLAGLALANGDFAASALAYILIASLLMLLCCYVSAIRLIAQVAAKRVEPQKLLTQAPLLRRTTSPRHCRPV